jgi:hypothetical protein
MPANHTTKDDDSAERLGRIVIIGMAILEAIIMAVAFFSKSHHALI